MHAGYGRSTCCAGVAHGRRGRDGRAARRQRRRQDDHAARDLRMVQRAERAPRRPRSPGARPEQIVRLGVAHVPEGRGRSRRSPSRRTSARRLYAPHGAVERGFDSSRAWRSAANSRRSAPRRQQQMLAIGRALMLRPHCCCSTNPRSGSRRARPRVVRDAADHQGAGRHHDDRRRAERHLALSSPTPRTCSRPGASCSSGPRARSPRTDRCARPTWVRRLERSAETLIDGIATGSIYGALALALGAHLPLDRDRQLRPGRAGDVQHLRRLGLVQAGLLIGLAGPDHARGDLLRRDADRARADPPGRGLARGSRPS